MKTELITMAVRAAERAAAILRAGGLVGLPTETVYGLGADGLNEAAVRRIFEAKGRPQDNPLILHVPEAVWLDRYCLDIPAEARDLAARFWPGPLTMILKRREIVPDAVTCGLETVGVRCPDHPAALAVIRAAGVPVAAPSGNRSGRPSPTCAAHMLEDMDPAAWGWNPPSWTSPESAPGSCAPADCPWRLWRPSWGKSRWTGQSPPPLPPGSAPGPRG